MLIFKKRFYVYFIHNCIFKMVLILIYVIAQSTLKSPFGGESERSFTLVKNLGIGSFYLRHLCWCSTPFSRHWSVLTARGNNVVRR